MMKNYFDNFFKKQKQALDLLLLEYGTLINQGRANTAKDDHYNTAEGSISLSSLGISNFGCITKLQFL